MITIGTFLNVARKEKNITFEKLESVTKIKRSFIKAMENEDWDNLPDYSVVLGFVRNISGSLDVSVNTALALLRRDYPPKTLKVTPSQDVEKKFSWSPKLTFFVGVGLFLIVLLGYLGFQYAGFVGSPQLVVNKPKEEEIVLSSNVLVEGTTETDAKVEVNNQPILVDADGNFKGNVEILKDTEEIIIKAISRSGKETVINRKIVVEFD